MREKDLFEKKRIHQRYHLNIVRDLRAIDDRRRMNNIRYSPDFRVTMSLLPNDYEVR